jgi:hypothetical protein
MNVCSCGWTIVSPLGVEDCVKHTMIHLKDNHPGTVMTHDEVVAHTRTI